MWLSDLTLFDRACMTLERKVSMFEYRISKHNPKWRNRRGHYTVDEWTCFSEVGKAMTLEESEEVEKRYIAAALHVGKSWGDVSIYVEAVEDYQDATTLKSGDSLE